MSSTYTFELYGGYLIDATYSGNYASFINHSCDPNSFALQWDHKGYDRIFIFARKRITAGTEITYDYNEGYYDTEDFIECNCQSGDKCSGVMGISKKALNKRPLLQKKINIWKQRTSRLKCNLKENLLNTKVEPSKRKVLKTEKGEAWVIPHFNKIIVNSKETRR